jgi:hypothetical protein
MNQEEGSVRGVHDDKYLLPPHYSGFEATLLALLKAQDDKFVLALSEAEKRNNQRFNAQQEGVKTAMDASEKAVNKAEVAADKRFDDLKDAIAKISRTQSMMIGAIFFASAIIPFAIYLLEHR